MVRAPEAGFDDNLGPVLVRSNKFVNVDNGVYLLSHPAAEFDSLTFLDNEIVLNGRNGWGVAACDVCGGGPSATITNVTALNNIIRYPDWLPRSSSREGGLLYSDIHQAVFGNNVIALGTVNPLRVRQCPAGLIPPPPETENCDSIGPAPRHPRTRFIRPAWMFFRPVTAALGSTTGIFKTLS